MSELKFLLKFGQEKYLKELVKGNLYCSNAITFWGIEENLKIKGQGDILEAGSRMFGHSMTMQEHGLDEILNIDTTTNVLVHFEPAKYIPIYCLFSVFDDECEIDDDGNMSIKLSEETKNTIKEHFPDADSVAVIRNPNLFIEDVRKSIAHRIESGVVQYFHIDEGFKVEGSNRVAMDMEYMKYLMQDVPPIIENGKKTYSFHAEYVYRALFCKDIFFKGEKEYRIVLPDEKIHAGTNYPVMLSEKIDLISLDKFWND